MLVCSALGIGVEAVVVTVVWATGTVHTLAGSPARSESPRRSCVGFWGAGLGRLVGVVNAVLLLLLASSGGSDIALLGIPRWRCGL